MTYKIGEKEFSVHLGMLFQEAWLKLIEDLAEKMLLSGKKDAVSLSETETAAFLIYHGNINYSKLNDVNPAFTSIGDVYKTMETEPNSPVYDEISKQYNDSQTAKTVLELTKKLQDAAKKAQPAKKKIQ
jgi:hypothetical protein